MLLRTLFCLGFPLLTILGLPACQEPPLEQAAHSDPFAHISDTTARSVLEKAMAAMGGLERWQSKKEIRFRKTYALLLENGEVESQASQQHLYSYDPKTDIQISWIKDGQSHLLQASDGKVTKSIEGKVDTSANPLSLGNTILSATFVANLPYNLLDTGAEISYAGLDTLETGQLVHAVRIAYNPETHVNHSTADIWWVYFDQQGYELVAYMVQHADHYSYVRNVSDTLVSGIRLVKDRKSWRVDSLRNPLYLRAQYAYRDYELAW